MAARGGKKAASTRSRAKAKEWRKNWQGLTLDFERYLPTVISSLVAKLRANANVFFTQSYGVSLAEWRILSFLAEYGPASAYDIWTRSNLDKAVVSRETGTLANKGLVEIEAVKGSVRKRSEIRLSKAGAALLKRSFQRGPAAARQSDRRPRAGLDRDVFARRQASGKPHPPYERPVVAACFRRHAPVKRIAQKRRRPGAKMQNLNSGCPGMPSRARRHAFSGEIRKSGRHAVALCCYFHGSDAHSQDIARNPCISLQNCR